jgi:ABC-2 type transport system ATP-binding protein
MPPAVETTGLTRTYRARRGEKETVALAGVDVEIRPGEVFGVLGPNGAGKTTLIKILATLLSPTGGTARVDGLDVVREAAEVRRRITMVSGGEHSGYGILTVRENIWMFSQFFGIPTRVATERTDALLARLGMTADAKTRVNKLSTGMRQKMNIIRGFVCEPKILFLDEPTLGLDVQVSREVRGLVKEWVAGAAAGAEKTVLLTTHYMQEADELCHRIAIVDRGRILACDTPAALKRRLKKESVFHLEVAGLASVDGLAALPGVARIGEVGAADGVKKLSAALVEEHAVAALISGIVDRGARLVSLAKIEPTLEDVFVSLVGHGIHDDEES